MLVINFFESFFNGLGGLMEFMNKPFTLYIPAGFNLGPVIEDYGGLVGVSVTPLTAFGVSIGAVLLICFVLHLWHLLKLVF